MNPLPNSNGTSRWSSTTSHSHSTSSNTVVLHDHVPPYVSVGHVSSHGPSHGLVSRTSYVTYYGPSYEKTYTCYGSGYQPMYHSPNYGFIAP